MGVSKLYQFLDKINALRKVKLSEEVHNLRGSRFHTPVIVVDALNLMYELYTYHRLSFLCGGQLKEYKAHLENFIEKFKKEGILLVFFFDGPSVLYNLKNWVTRRKNKIKVLNTVFDKINQEKSLEDIENSTWSLILPKNIWEVTIFVLKQKGCKIKIAVAGCDKELAMYAHRNNCMAILAKDTDFVIYDTVKTISTIRMDLDRLEFYIYEKKKVLEVLKLRPQDLPLFASLVGNDYIPASTLYNGFHARFRKQGEKFNLIKTFCGIAQYITKLNLSNDCGEISKNDLKHIAKQVFQDESKHQLLQESINFYNIIPQSNEYEEIMRHIHDTKWRNIVEMVYHDYSENGETSIIFSIMGKQCLQLSNTLEDFRCLDIPPVTEVLKPLRKKLYGLLLFEKPGLKTVKEWVVDGYDSLSQPKEVCPILPNVHHPGIVYLYEANDKKACWELLGDIFNLNPAHAKDIPQHLFIPVLTFRYLKDIVAINKWEMDALIVSASLVRYFNVNELKDITINHVSSRSIRLYNLVTNAYGAILEIFQVLRNIVSSEMTVPCNYQDGKLFHIIYKMSCDLKGSKKEILKQVVVSFRTKASFYDTWKEQVKKISEFIT